MPDEQMIEIPLSVLLRHGGKIIHMNECAREQWKSGNPAGALIYFDRSDNEMGRAFKKLAKDNPELADQLLAAAADANEGK